MNLLIFMYFTGNHVTLIFEKLAIQKLLFCDRKLARFYP